MLSFRYLSVENRLSFFHKRKRHSWNIIFFGNDNFSSVSLQELIKRRGPENIVNKLKVVTLSQENSNPVLKLAKTHNIEVDVWPPLITEPYHLGIVVSFGKLIPKRVIDFFPMGILNVHGSLLPKYRGSAPIIHALMNGETETGISIMKIKPEKFDIGDIILQKQCSIATDFSEKDELMPSLYKRLSLLGAEGLIQAISDLPDCLSHAVPQSNESFTHAPKISKDNAIVNWNDITAVQIYNRYRALYSIYELRTAYENHPVKLKNMSLNGPCNECIVEEDSCPPGRIHYCRHTRSLKVKCKEGYVDIYQLSFKGKIKKAIDFYHAFVKGMVLEKRRFQQF